MADQTPGAEAPSASPAAPLSQASAPPVDVEAIRQAAKAEAETAFLGKFKETTGFDTLDAYQADKLKADGKLQELADQHAASAQSYKTKYQQSTIGNAILAASTDALDPSDVLVHLASKCVCGEDGAVTVDGKPVADAVKALLAAKPHLAKAQGGTGSGAGQNLGGGKTLSRAKFDKLPALDKSTFARTGGIVTE